MPSNSKDNNMFNQEFDYKGFDYEVWGIHWDDMKRYGPTSRHIRRLILQLIKGLEFTSMLDVSCGQGELLHDIQLHYPHATLYGTEYSEDGLNLSQRYVPEATFYQLDLVERALDQTFDLVICSDVLEHIVDDRQAIANLFRMARKSLVVTTVQGPFYECERETVGHVRSYRRTDLEEKLRAAGFRIVKVYEWGWPFYSPLYRSFLAMSRARGTTGAYGPVRRLVAHCLYILFLLNTSHRGDVLSILAEIP